MTNDDILRALTLITNPQNQKNIVESQLVDNVLINGNNVEITFKLTHSTKPLLHSLEKAVKTVMADSFGSDVNVSIKTLQAQPTPKAEKTIPLSGVKHIIAVSSGKGGVGKSTVTANLAVALAMSGKTVGLIDADVFGPSMPKMFGLEDFSPDTETIDGKTIIVPARKYGVKMLSMGFFVDSESPVIWRGPMASNMLNQIINDADWGQLDYLLFDLPPGTSDIHLTVVQTVKLAGAIIVSTPQQVAMADVIKGINMFRNDKIDVPILGIVENMAWFTPAELPNNKYYIFGKDGSKPVAEKYGIDLLGQIPIVQSICESGDLGKPTVLDKNSIQAEYFFNVANKIIDKLEK
mgnify:CR=1 FL=1